MTTPVKTSVRNGAGGADEDDADVFPAGPADPDVIRLAALTSTACRLPPSTSSRGLALRELELALRALGSPFLRAEPPLIRPDDDTSAGGDAVTVVPCVEPNEADTDPFADPDDAAIARRKLTRVIARGWRSARTFAGPHEQAHRAGAFGQSLIATAARCNVHPGGEVVTLLLRCVPRSAASDLDADADSNGITPLHYAAERLVRDPEAIGIRAMLARGADPMRPSTQLGATPLHVACANDTIGAALHAMLDSIPTTADVTAFDDKRAAAAEGRDRSRSAAAFTASGSRFGSGDAGAAWDDLVGDGRGRAPPLRLCDTPALTLYCKRLRDTREGSARTVKRLMRRGANPLARDNGGISALHWAVENDDMPGAPTVCALLASVPMGVDVNVPTDAGKFAIRSALRFSLNWYKKSQPPAVSSLHALLARGTPSVPRKDMHAWIVEARARNGRYLAELLARCLTDEPLHVYSDSVPQASLPPVLRGFHARALVLLWSGVGCCAGRAATRCSRESTRSGQGGDGDTAEPALRRVLLHTLPRCALAEVADMLRVPL